MPHTPGDVLRAAPSPPASGPSTLKTQPAVPHAVTSGARTHEHRLAEPQAWPWLPTTRGGPIVQHPYCADCGSIKSIGSDRAMDLGGLMNLMGRLRRLLEARGHRLTEVQRRLIVQRLEALNADDRFGQSRSNQYALMAECVGRVTGIPDEVVHSYLHHC